MKIAEVIPLVRLPRTVRQSFSYRARSNLGRVIKGSLVTILFRGRRVVGVVKQIANKKKPNYKVQDIIDVLPYKPLTSGQLELAGILRDNYAATSAATFRVIVPALSKKTVANKLSREAPQIKLPLLDQRRKKIFNALLNGRRSSLLVGRLFDPREAPFPQFIKKRLGKTCQVLLLFADKISLAAASAYYKKTFPNITEEWHGSLTSVRAAAIWNTVAAGEVRLILGTRDSIFLPFKKLNTIILFDVSAEGHKSWDMQPHYDVRYLMEKTRENHKINLVMTGAIPTLNEAINATTITWKAFLKQRIILLNRDNLDPSFRASTLPPFIKETIASSRGHVLIYINRKGYALLTCRDCEYTLRCKTCGQPYAYMTNQNKSVSLACFQCGTETESPSSCPRCRGVNLRFVGLGIEKVFADVKSMFPMKRIQRFEAKTMSSAEKVSEALNLISKANVDITIATAMILPRLWLIPRSEHVVVLRADSLFARPSWRVNEEALSALYTLSLSAAKSCVIDTGVKDHPVITAIQTGKLKDFVVFEQESRKRLGYPPYTKIVTIDIPQNSVDLLSKFLDVLARRVKVKPIITKAKANNSRYIFKLPPQASLTEYWHFLPAEAKVDVNPWSLV